MAPSPPRVRRTGRTVRAAVLLVVVVLAVVLGIAFWDEFRPGVREHLGYVGLAAALGSTVGASELISRYRDEPLQALLSNAGLLYMALNATVSACTYGLLTKYAQTLIPGLTGDPWMTAIVAGFAAMAVLRSKFFTIRTEKGEDVAVGPDAAVSAFLAAADRGVDRARASRRLDLVFRRTADVTTPADGRDFLEISLAALQNLDTDEKRALSESITAIGSKSYPEELKLQAICYLLLGATGERNLSDMLTNLTSWSKSRSDATAAGGPAAPAVAGAPSTEG